MNANFCSAKLSKSFPNMLILALLINRAIIIICTTYVCTTFCFVKFEQRKLFANQSM